MPRRRASDRVYDRVVRETFGKRYHKDPVIEARLTVVAEGMLAYRPPREMAEELGVPVKQIFADMDAIKAWWASYRLQTVDAYAAEEMARLNAAEKAIWGQVVRGKLFAIDRLLAIIKLRSELFGMNERVDIREYVWQRASAEGLDPEAVLVEVEQLLATTK